MAFESLILNHYYSKFNGVFWHQIQNTATNNEFGNGTSLFISNGFNRYCLQDNGLHAVLQTLY